jgi:hypothetical protein
MFATQEMSQVSPVIAFPIQAPLAPRKYALKLQLTAEGWIKITVTTAHDDHASDGPGWEGLGLGTGGILL